MKRATVLLAALAPVAVAGCGHVETHQALLRAPAEAVDRPADLYMIDQPLPSQPFYEIALVQAVGFGADADPEDVARALAKKAAKLGCDAVLRTAIDQGYSRTNASGVCVKWVGPRPASNAPELAPGHGANPPPPPVRPAPAPGYEPLPSAGPERGGGR